MTGMQMCQCLEEMRIEYAQSEEVAFIQRGANETLWNDKVLITYAQVYRWQQELRELLCVDSGENEWFVAINLMPFSIEETVAMLVVAEQRHWTYVPVDKELPLPRQLSLLQSAGVRRLVTTVDSELVKVLVGDEDQNVRITKSWTVDLTMSPFLPVQVISLPINYFQTESSLTRPRWSDGQAFVMPLYVLFTSGTTGTAKGVVGTREGAWTRLKWMWKTYPFTTYDASSRTSERVLRATKLWFVDSVWEILGAFLQHVPLIHLHSLIHGEGGIRYSCMTSVMLDNSPRVLEIIRSESVTRFTAVPSVLEVLLLQTTEYDRSSCLDGLRYVLSSGEPLPLHVLQQLTASLPNVTVLNLFGSTEVSGDITCMELKPPFSTVQMAEWQELGIPIASFDEFGVIGGSEMALVLVPVMVEESALCSSNSSATLIWPKKSVTEPDLPAEVDEQRTTGVLYVSGPLLSYGYIDDAQKDVFIDSDVLLAGQSKSSREPAVQPRRWFCTGDICSISRGRLYFCGRMDNAVKVHGKRVYMEAVERAVAFALKQTTRDSQVHDHGQVYAFSMTKQVTKHACLKTRIVACIVRDDLINPAITQYSPTNAFDAWIDKSYGPSHIPDEVLLIAAKAVPRLAHGKTNRRALETLVIDFTDHCNVPLPRPCIQSNANSGLENIVATLLNEILDISPSADVLDDSLRRTFRELGGDSLLATLFVHELRKELGKLSLTSQDLLDMKMEDVMSRCMKSFLAAKQPRKKKTGESSMESAKRASVSSLVSRAGELKRQKKTKHTSLEDSVGSCCHTSRSQDGRLMILARYNRSSASVHGLYLPMCCTSLLPSTNATVLASSSCLSWELRRMWQVGLEKCIDASPTVVQRRDHEGSVCSTWAVIGSHSAQLVCVDVMEAGQEIWRVTLDDRIEACAAISVKNESVYVGTYAGTLFALSLQSGTTRWKFYATGIIKASAIVMDGQRLIVCGAYDKMFYGLDSLTGTQRWAVDLHGSIFSTPLYCAWSDQLFAATTNGIVVALHSSSKFQSVKEQWKLKVPASVFAGLNVDYTSKMLIVGSADGHLYGVQMDTGSIQWQVTTEKPIFSSPCIYQPRSVVFGSHDGILRKADCQSGKLAWTTNLHSAIFASPTVVRLRHPPRPENQSEHRNDDCLLCCVTTTGGSIYFCDERTGSIVYQTSASTGQSSSSDQCRTDLGPLFGSPVMIDNYCLLGTRTNQFYGFKLVCRSSAAAVAC